MKTFTFLLIILFFISHNSIIAQKCGSSLNIQLLQKENPELYNRLLYIENSTKNYIDNYSLKEATTTSVIRIPIVVHVLYNSSTQNISDAQISSQIAVLNEDFRRQNVDKSNTPSAFSSVASDTEFEFFSCLH